MPSSGQDGYTTSSTPPSGGGDLPYTGGPTGDVFAAGTVLLVLGVGAYALLARLSRKPQEGTR